MGKRRIALISTGGTIDKTYDELEGILHNQLSVLDMMIASLLLEGVDVVRVPLMNKDSLDMVEADHRLIAETAGSLGAAHDGVVIVHGTDRLSVTGETIVRLLAVPRVPIVLTGAMRPYVMRNTDALQNMTEALLAVQILEPGVYVAMHNKVLRFPGVKKDRRHGTFVRESDA
jgi:L-asparaginase